MGGHHNSSELSEIKGYEVFRADTEPQKQESKLLN
jgi:hypothetical protein